MKRFTMVSRVLTSSPVKILIFKTAAPTTNSENHSLTYYIRQKPDHNQIVEAIRNCCPAPPKWAEMVKKKA
jgi:hypothetical protein